MLRQEDGLFSINVVLILILILFMIGVFSLASRRRGGLRLPVADTSLELAEGAKYSINTIKNLNAQWRNLDRLSTEPGWRRRLRWQRHPRPLIAHPFMIILLVFILFFLIALRRFT